MDMAPMMILWTRLASCEGVANLVCSVDMLLKNMNHQGGFKRLSSCKYFLFSIEVIELALCCARLATTKDVGVCVGTAVCDKDTSLRKVCVKGAVNYESWLLSHSCASLRLMFQACSKSCSSFCSVAGVRWGVLYRVTKPNQKHMFPEPFWLMSTLGYVRDVGQIFLLKV